MDFLETIRRQLTEFFGKLEKKQIIRLAVLGFLILLVCIVAIVLLNHKEYSVLFSDMDDAELAEVYSKLKDDGVDVKTSGQNVLVLKDEAEDLRWRLVSQGYPQTGLNYDFFNASSGLGSTDAKLTAAQRFDLEKNLRTTITSLDKIADALVLLNIQQNSPFALSVNIQPSTASVTITLRDPAVPLTEQEADTLRRIVTYSVPGLLAENVSVADTQMRSYEPVDEEELAQRELEATPDHIALTEQVQQRFNQGVLTLLKPIFGQVQVQSAVTLNFDKRSSQSVVFSPPVDGMETGIPISMKELNETIRGDGAAIGEPGLDENGGAPSYVEINDQNALYTKASVETNMEINEVKTLVDRAKGSIEELSMSVIIPLADDMDDYTADVRELVATAIGTGIENITVKRMPVQTADTSAAMSEYGKLLESERQAKLMEALIIAAAIVIVVVLLLIALRMVLRVLRPEPVIVEAEEVQDMDSAMQSGRYFDTMVGSEDEEELEEEEEEFVSQIPTKTNADIPTTQIQKFIEKDPEAVAQLLRNWLTDDYR